MDFARRRKWRRVFSIIGSIEQLIRRAICFASRPQKQLDAIDNPNTFLILARSRQFAELSDWAAPARHFQIRPVKPS
jgi:hypothetical protein